MWSALAGAIKIVPCRMKYSSSMTGRVVSDVTPRTVRVVAWRRRVSLKRAWSRGSVRSVSRLKELGHGLDGSVACWEIVDRIESLDGDARTWSIYHIEAGSGFA